MRITATIADILCRHRLRRAYRSTDVGQFRYNLVRNKIIMPDTLAKFTSDLSTFTNRLALFGLLHETGHVCRRPSNIKLGAFGKVPRELIKEEVLAWLYAFRCIRPSWEYAHEMVEDASFCLSSYICSVARVDRRWAKAYTKRFVRRMRRRIECAHKLHKLEK